MKEEDDLQPYTIYFRHQSKQRHSDKEMEGEALLSFDVDVLDRAEDMLTEVSSLINKPEVGPDESSENDELTELIRRYKKSEEDASRVDKIQDSNRGEANKKFITFDMESEKEERKKAGNPVSKPYSSSPDRPAPGLKTIQLREFSFSYDRIDMQSWWCPCLLLKQIYS